MIKNVIFDLDGVIMDYKNATIEEVLPADLKKRYKSKYKKITLKDFIKKTEFNGHIKDNKMKLETYAASDDYDRGILTEEEYLTIITNASTEPAEVISAVYAKRKLKSYRKTILSTINLVRKLKQEKYKVYILANVNADMVGTVLSMIDEREFDGIFFSCNTGKIKPEQATYEYALRKWKIKADESVLIDDKQSNLTPFTRLGGHTILFETENAAQENKRVYDYIYKINMVKKN